RHGRRPWEAGIGSRESFSLIRRQVNEARGEQRPVSRIVEVDAQGLQPGRIDGVGVDQTVRFEPDAAVTDVGDLYSQVSEQLALHRDVPLVDAARAASVAIHHDAPPEVAETTGLPRQGTDAWIERRREQVGPIVLKTIAHQEGRLAEGWVAEINRVETQSQRGRTTGDVPPVGQLAVAHAPTGARHGLFIQPVSD